MSAPLFTHIPRFDRRSRLLHIVLMTCFLGLAATGLPLLFSEEAWGRTLALLFGGFRGAGLAHRAFGATLLAAMAWHLGDVLWRGVVKREPGIFWGPTSMVPQPRDLSDLWAQVKWFLGTGPQPRFEHFTYWEKFDYWAVLWGTGLMGLAGLILWFPVAASRVVPGWVFNLALFVHGAEATLAIGFIFVVHFFNGHLRPGKFPMDLVIFTGAVSMDELAHERAGEYERLSRDPALSSLLVSPPSADTIRRGRFIGTTGLTIGLALIVLIIYAVVRQSLAGPVGGLR
ncbi:MAG: formate dehydrogenase subunit gamma [Vicinamibacterales bacterium]